MLSQVKMETGNKNQPDPNVELLEVNPTASASVDNGDGETSLSVQRAEVAGTMASNTPPTGAGPLDIEGLPVRRYPMPGSPGRAVRCEVLDKVANVEEADSFGKPPGAYLRKPGNAGISRSLPEFKDDKTLKEVADISKSCPEISGIKDLEVSVGGELTRAEKYIKDCAESDEPPVKERGDGKSETGSSDATSSDKSSDPANRDVEAGSGDATRPLLPDTSGTSTAVVRTGFRQMFNRTIFARLCRSFRNTRLFQYLYTHGSRRCYCTVVGFSIVAVIVAYLLGKLIEYLMSFELGDAGTGSGRKPHDAPSFPGKWKPGL